MRAIFIAGVLAAHAAHGAVAQGRNWRIDVGSVACEANDSVLAVGMRVRYLGPKGPVEAPAHRLVDAGGRAYAPRGLVWKSGSKQLAQWLPKGGIDSVQAEDLGEVQLKYDVRGSDGELQLEFGDIKVFALTRKAGCRSVLKAGEVQAPKAARAAAPQEPKDKVAVFRAAYPCRRPDGALRVVEAGYPPHAPQRLLVFGRGYLPSARQVDLPMGKVAAQSYSYLGADELVPIENAARQAIATDFGDYRASLTRVTQKQHLVPGRTFAFNWGWQASASGNELYSIGLYELKPCQKS